MKTFTLFCCMLLGVAVMQAQIPTDNLVGYWPFNGNANDESGNNNNGIIHGVVLTADRFGTPDKAYSFDGNDFIEIPSLTPIQNNSISQFTFTCWVNFRSDINTCQQLLEGITSTGEIFVETGSETIGFSISYDNGYSTIVSDQLLLGTWYFVAGTYDGSVQKIYINGFLQNSSEFQGSFTIVTGLNFGRDYESEIQYLDGILDDIYIFDRVLDEKEILTIYHEGGWAINASIASIIPDQAVCRNDSASFRILADGIPPITYQWQKNGGNIPVATDSVLSFVAVMPDDAGEYRCIVSNEYGSDTSNSAKLSIEFDVPTVITGPPGVCEYQVVLYSVPKQEDHTREFIVQGGNKIGATGNTVTVHWGPPGVGSVSLIETSELGCTADTVTLQVDISPLGMNNRPSDASTLTIYPNPTSTDITIKTSSQGQLSILSLNGQPLITRQVNEAKTVVDISTLPSGVYVVKVVGDKGVQVGKLIKE